jgi:hypothetical protein
MENENKVKVNNKELKDILTKYPKTALKGIPIFLDAEWKKDLVAFMCIVNINIGLKTRANSFGNSISEEFESQFATGKEMQETPENIEQLKIVLQIKKRLEESIKLQRYVEKLHKVITTNSSQIEKDTYLYYVGAHASLLQELKESQKIIDEIIASIKVSYKNLNVVVLQEEIDKTATTEQDILKLLKKVENSLDIELVE